MFEISGKRYLSFGCARDGKICRHLSERWPGPMAIAMRLTAKRPDGRCTAALVR